jgi:lipopolysaccharide cholinephosphotransferase
MDDQLLRKLQKTELEILDCFVDFCHNHNLKYFLIGGTLLGAIRHKGFIPWDDDIDIGMVREDYEKLIELFYNEFDNEYYLKSLKNSEPYWFHYVKICKKNTLFHENDFITIKQSNGIFIDVLPFDNVIKCYPLQFYQDIRMTFFKKFIRAKIKSQNRIIKNPIIKIFVGFFSYRFLQQQITNTSLLLNNIRSKYLGLIGGGYGFVRETHLKTTIFPLTTVIFEGKEYFAPNDYTTFLSSLYGNDYMELPPPEKRVSHNPRILSFDTTKQDVP